MSLTFNDVYDHLYKTSEGVNMHVFFDKCLSSWITGSEYSYDSHNKKFLILTITYTNQQALKRDLNHILNHGGKFIIRNVNKIYVCEHGTVKKVFNEYRISDFDLKCEILELLEVEKSKTVGEKELYKDYIITLDELNKKYQNIKVFFMSSPKLELKVSQNGFYQEELYSFNSKIKLFMDLNMTVKFILVNTQMIEIITEVYINDGVIYHADKITRTFKHINNIQYFDYTDDIAKKFNLMNSI